MRRAAIPAALSAACVWGWICPSGAQSSAPAAGSTQGYFRVPVAGASPRRLLLAGAVGYGITESQEGAPGSHHRVAGQAAATLTPWHGFDLGLVTRLRHDMHDQDPLGSDRTSNLSSGVSVRAGERWGSGFHFGLELSANFPGGDDASHSLENPALDGHLLAAYLPERAAWSVGMLAGYRYDRTAAAVSDPGSFRPGDRLSLGLSSFDAIPLGVGADYRFGSTRWLTELSTELLIGAGAPTPLQSPWRIGAGARHQLRDDLALTWTTETSLSSRPPSGGERPLIPIEPRFQLLVGVAYALFDRDRAAEKAAVPRVLVRTPAPAPAVAIAPASLQVKVTTADGYPLSDATVELEFGSRVLSVPHEHLESYRLAELTPGTAVLRVSAPRLKPARQELQLPSGAALLVEIRLESAPPSGQLQGLVRTLDGQRLQARIRIEPSGTELETDPAGTFSVDVAPGRYEVSIESPGYEAQRRQVQVRPDGVVVLNADLSKAAR